MVALSAEIGHDFSGGVVGIGNEVEMRQTERLHKQHHLIQEGSCIPVGEDKTFMYTAYKRNGEDTSERACQNGDGLAGMAHDVLRFGVGV